MLAMPNYFRSHTGLFRDPRLTQRKIYLPPARLCVRLPPIFSRRTAHTSSAHPGAAFGDSVHLAPKPRRSSLDAVRSSAPRSTRAIGKPSWVVGRLHVRYQRDSVSIFLSFFVGDGIAFECGTLTTTEFGCAQPYAM